MWFKIYRILENDEVWSNLFWINKLVWVELFVRFLNDLNMFLKILEISIFVRIWYILFFMIDRYVSVGSIEFCKFSIDILFVEYWLLRFLSIYLS